MRLTIGVLGLPGQDADEDTVAQMILLGRAIAERACALIAGGYGGYPAYRSPPPVGTGCWRDHHRCLSGIVKRRAQTQGRLTERGI